MAPDDARSGSVGVFPKRAFSYDPGGLHSGNMYSNAAAANDVATRRSDARARTPAISVASAMQFAISITHSAFWSLAGKWLHIYSVCLADLADTTDISVISTTA